jgi:hypothetical protein
MIHKINIGGEEIGIAWNQQTARSFAYRASKIGGPPSLRDLTNPKRAVAAVTDLLWLLLPPETSAKYRTPEDLFLAIDHDNDAVSIHAALVQVISDMSEVDVEKKSNLKKSPSRKSS